MKRRAYGCFFLYFHKVTNGTGQTIAFQVSPAFDSDFKPVPNNYRVGKLWFLRDFQSIRVMIYVIGFSYCHANVY